MPAVIMVTQNKNDQNLIKINYVNLSFNFFCQKQNKKGQRECES